MYRIPKDALPIDEATLRAALEKYRSELEAHKLTEGVPAPWPDYEILRDIMSAGGDFEVIYPPPPSPRELALRALAEKQHRDAIAAENRILVLEARKPDAPKELKDYIAANPEIVAAVEAEEAAAKRRP